MDVLGQKGITILISLLHYLESVDFKSDICSKKCRAQILKFEHFGPKYINLSILLIKLINLININL